MNRFTLIVALVSLLFAATAASGQIVTPTPVTVASGFLASTNDADGSIRVHPHRIHLIDLLEGRTYLLRMESSEARAYMMIEDLLGNPLATDSDDFVTMPACIVFRAPATGSYRLIAAATVPIEEGFYRITMREVPSLFEVAAELTPNDPLNNDCHERTYDLPLIEGRRYVIDLGSRDFDAYVKLMTTENVIVAFEDESTPTRGARIVFTAPRTEVFRIAATSVNPRSTGVFTLNVTELE